jgi:hypothetical protein
MANHTATARHYCLRPRDPPSCIFLDPINPFSCRCISGQHGSSHGLSWADNPGSMQRGNELPSPIRQLMAPRIGTKRTVRLTSKVKDGHRSIPDGLTFMFLMDTNGLDERCLAAVLGFHGLLEFIDQINIPFVLPISPS